MPEPAILELDGDWDMRRREELHDLLAGVVGAQHVLVDLSAAHFMDSTALGEFVRLMKQRQERGLSSPVFVVNEWLGRLFDVVGFMTLFSVFSSRDEALASFAQPERL